MIEQCDQIETFIKWLPFSRSKRNGAIYSSSIGEHNHQHSVSASDFMFAL